MLTSSRSSSWPSSASVAFGHGGWARSGGRPPRRHRRDVGRMQASWKTPTMPVGPSYVDCSSLSRSTRSGSVAVPVTGIGRVWGVSAEQRAERDDQLDAELVASRAARRRTAATACWARCRAPGSRRGRGRVASTTAIWVVGQVIRRCRPSSSDRGPVDLEVVVVLGVDGADDRRVHTRSRWSTTDEAASPASFQPSKAAMITGSTSSGTSSISITQRLLPARQGDCSHPRRLPFLLRVLHPAYGFARQVPPPS